MTVFGFLLFTILLEKTKNLILLGLVNFLLLGIAEGFLIIHAFSATRNFATKEVLGFIMTLQTGGSSLGALILPPLYIFVLEKIDNNIIQMCYLIAIFQKGLNVLAGLLLPVDSPNAKKSETQQVKYIENSESQPLKLQATPVESELTSENNSEEVQVKIESSDPQQNSNNSIPKSPESPKPIAKFFSKTLFFTDYYYTFVIGICLFLMGYFCVVINIKPLLASYGLSSSTISKILLSGGIVEIISRGIYAIFLVDSSDVVILLAVTFICDGLGSALLCLPMLDALRQKIFYVMPVPFATFCFFNAGFGGVMNAVLVKILPKHQFEVGMGMYQLAMGIGNGLGPFLGGSLVDYIRENHYDNSTVVDNFDGFDMYKDPYWATLLMGGLAFMVPGGLCILILKKWF